MTVESTNDVYSGALLEQAYDLGIDPDEEEDLMYIAEEALQAQLPLEWSTGYTDVDGESYTYYYNEKTGESVWEHPLLSYFKERVATARAERDGRNVTGIVSESSNADSYSQHGFHRYETSDISDTLYHSDVLEDSQNSSFAPSGTFAGPSSTDPVNSMSNSSIMSPSSALGGVHGSRPGMFRSPPNGSHSPELSDAKSNIKRTSPPGMSPPAVAPTTKSKKVGRNVSFSSPGPDSLSAAHHISDIPLVTAPSLSSSESVSTKNISADVLNDSDYDITEMLDTDDEYLEQTEYVPSGTSAGAPSAPSFVSDNSTIVADSSLGNVTPPRLIHDKSIGFTPYTPLPIFTPADNLSLNASAASPRSARELLVLRNDLEKTQKDYQLALKSIDELKAEASRVNSMISSATVAAEAATRDLKSKLEASEAQLVASEKETEELQEKLKVAALEIVELKSTVKLHQTDIDRLSMEVQSKKREDAAENESLLKAKAYITALQAVSYVKEREHHYELAQARSSSVSEELEQRDREQDALLSLYEERVEEIKALQKIVEELRVKNEELQHSNAVIASAEDTEVESLRAEVLSQAEKLAVQERGLEESAVASIQLRDELEALRRREGELERDLAKTQETLAGERNKFKEAAKMMLSETAESVSAVQERLDASEAEMKALQEELEIQQAAVQEAEALISAQKLEIEQLSARAADAEAHSVNRTAEIIDTPDSLKEELSEHIASLEAEIQRLRARCIELERSEGVNDRALQLERELASLRASSAAAEALARAQVARAENRLAALELQVEAAAVSGSSQPERRDNSRLRTALLEKEKENEELKENLRQMQAELVKYRTQTILSDMNMLPDPESTKSRIQNAIRADMKVAPLLPRGKRYSYSNFPLNSVMPLNPDLGRLHFEKQDQKGATVVIPGGSPLSTTTSESVLRLKNTLRSNVLREKLNSVIEFS